MASLSHASFATPNTQQLSPSHMLLPSHLSMDPASSSSLSTLSQPFSSPELTTWLQKPNAKISYSQPPMMSSFNHQYGISSPLYDGYSDAGDSVEQGFIGGDDPILTSSWEALDKLVSASMIGSGTANGAELSEFAYSSAHGSALQGASPGGVVEQKPLSVLIGSNNQKSGAHNLWVNSQASGSNANAAHTTSSNAGLNLASLISADPGFVERAAKFSSYSQQAHNTSLQNQRANNKTITNIALSLENSYPACAKKLASMNATKALYTNGLMGPKGDNVAMECDAKSNRKVSTIGSPTTHDQTKQANSPQRLMPNSSGIKKKREGSSKDGEVEDAGATVGRKRAKGEEDKTSSVKNNTIKAGRVNGGDHKPTMHQSAASNSADSEQKSGGGGGKEIVSKPIGSNITTNTNASSASQAPKPDFIHVRARRGQATDSHSLAERVRREKISERMKFLQDLVPGCTKVTGKAMMLDEIINYVQSLQRQVEFLSMKLAAVHPSKLEFNFESLFGKEVVQQSIVQSSPPLPYAPETHPLFKSYPLVHETMHPLPPHHEAFPESNPSSNMHSYGSDAGLRGTLSMLAANSSDTFGDQSISSQMTNSWDEDLHNLVQLGFPQTALNANSSLHSLLHHDHTKTEL